MKERTKFDLTNACILAYQPAGDLAQLAAHLGRIENDHSTVWIEAARKNIADIRVALDEIEAILTAPAPRRMRR